MAVTKQEIKKLAGLCRIDLAEGEEERLEKDLSSILGYVKQLEQADTEGVDPTFQVSGAEGNLRPDKASQQPEETGKKLMEAVPQKEEGLIRVRAVLDKSES